MTTFIVSFLGSNLIPIQRFFSGIDPAYVDLMKIFAGSIGWIGGLTIFMWSRERKKQAHWS